MYPITESALVLSTGACGSSSTGIVWPAQATSYKMGMLKILELRQKAKDALGEKFDIRKFHTIVLDQGIVPLFVLEDIIDEWIESYGP